MGDEPYYGKSGFKPIPKGRAVMPGPVDPARLLVCELAEGAFEGVSGLILPGVGRDGYRVRDIRTYLPRRGRRFSLEHQSRHKCRNTGTLALLC